MLTVVNLAFPLPPSFFLSPSHRRRPHHLRPYDAGARQNAVRDLLPFRPLDLEVLEHLPRDFLARLLLAVNIAHFPDRLARAGHGRVVREVGRARPHGGHTRVGRDLVDGLSAAELAAEDFLVVISAVFLRDGEEGGWGETYS